MRHSRFISRRPMRSFGSLLALAGLGTAGLAATNIDQSAATGCSTYAVGDIVWIDADGDGVQGPNEHGLAGVKVEMLGQGRSTVTDKTGHFMITGLPAGTYQLRFANLPSGYQFTTLNAPGVAVTADSNTGSNGVTGAFTLGPVSPALPNMTNTTIAGHVTAMDATIDAGVIATTVDPPPPPTTVPSPPTTVKPSPTTTKASPSTTEKPHSSTTKPAPPTSTPVTTKPAPPTSTPVTTTPAPPTTKPVPPTSTPVTTTPAPPTTKPVPPTSTPVTTTPAPPTTKPAPSTTVTSPTAVYYAVGDKVWLDANRNGRQDSGESIVAGVLVELRSATGAIRTTTTNAQGTYTFDELLAGSYTVSFSAPVGFRWTTPTRGDAAGDSDANAAGLTGSIVLAEGQSHLNKTVPAGVNAVAIDDTVDAGLWQPLAIGDRVWLDVNANGIQDDGDNGVSGVIVELLDETNAAARNADGQLVGNATTDSSGHYRFDNLLAGRYHVRFRGIPAEDSFTVADVATATDGTDSDANADTGIAVVDLSATSPNVTAVLSTDGVSIATVIDRSIDAGLTLPSLSLGNRVWFDANANGRVDLAEAGLDNVAVTLLKVADDGARSSVGSTRTSGGGYYRFDRLSSGTYVVQIDASNFDSGAALFQFASVAIDESNADDDIDSNDNGLGTDTAAVTSSPITLGVPEALGESDLGVGGQGNPDANANMTIDFGFTTPFNLAISTALLTPELGQGTGANYRIVVTNTTGAPANGVVVVDDLPAGLSYVSASGDHWICSAVGQRVTCLYDTTLPGGGSASIDLMTQVTIPNGVINNVAQVNSPRDLDDPQADNRAQVEANVVTRVLPRTGASNISGMAMMAALFFLAGLGLMIGDRLRRTAVTA
jgi:uncharacterized repeat protein (TIGR01451 family)